MRRIWRWQAGLIVAAAALGAGACGGGAGPSAPTPVATPTPAPRPTPAATARYRVTFDATWSAQTHPTDIPRQPHFSGLIGATHRDDVRFWREGGMATEGIRLMAQEGSKSPLDQELNAAIDAGRAEHLLSGGGISRSPGTVSLEFEIGRDLPLVTLVSMLAPSPDWFVGVSALPLIENGAWLERREVVLHAYDAGTDSGTTFESADRDTLPRAPIARIADGPLRVGADVPPVGTFTFERLQ